MGIELGIESFAYPGSSELFQSLQLRIETGEAVAIVGSSGVGKSTLISLLAGLHPEPLGGIWKGRYLLDSHELETCSPQDRVTKLGYLGPDPKLFLTGFCATVREEVGWSLFGLGWDIETIEIRVRDTLDELGLTDLADSVPQRLSGGQQQMVSLATVWARRPKYLLLDNPVSSLDPDARRHLIAEIQRLRQQLGTSVVFATARSQDIAWCETVYCLQGDPTRSPIRMARVSLPDWDPTGSGCIVDEVGYVAEKKFCEREILGDNKVQILQCESESGAAIDIDSLTYTPPGHLSPLFENLHWQVKTGESVALLGANGSGKSTLGRILRGLVRGIGGTVMVAGRKISDFSIPQMTSYVAYTYQEPSNLFLQRSVSDEFLYSGQLLGLSLEKAKSRREQALDLFALKACANHHPRELPESDSALLGLALSWYSKAAVQILDEPSARLDAWGRHVLDAVLTHWRVQGTTVILIDHDIKWVMRRADIAFTLRNGGTSGKTL